MTTRKSTLKNIVSGCVVRSEHRIDILNVKSVRKKHLNVFITEPPIEKMVSFWDPVKKPPEAVYKKKFSLKILQYSQQNICFNKVIFRQLF